jgi:hypothetical protein
MVRVLPVKLDAVTLKPVIVEPVRVDKTVIAFAVTVLPPSVDT